MKRIALVLFVAFVALTGAYAASEVDRLKQEYNDFQKQLHNDFQKQLQYWQQEYDRRAEDLNRATSASNDVLRHGRPKPDMDRQQAAVERAKSRCDDAQKQIDATKRNMDALGKQINAAIKVADEQERAEKIEREYQQMEQERQRQEETKRRQQEAQRQANTPRVNFPGSGRFSVGPNDGDTGEVIIDFSLWKSTNYQGGSMVNPFGIKFSVKLPPGGNYHVDILTPGVSYGKDSGPGVVAWVPRTGTAHISVTGQYTGNEVTVRVTRRGSGAGQAAILAGCEHL